MKAQCQAVAVRYVHDVLTGEFLNVGVVLLCPERSFVGARFLSQWSRVTAAFPGADLAHLRRTAARIIAVIDAERERVQLPYLLGHDIVQFMANVLPPIDGSLQLSPTMRGSTDDPERTLRELYRRYVETYVTDDTERAPRSDEDVWRAFMLKHAARLKALEGFQRFALRAPKSANFRVEFDMGWKNGTMNLAQPLSFDLIETQAIYDKTSRWTGRVLTLRPSEQNAHIAFLVGMPPSSASDSIRDAAFDALGLLSENVGVEAEVFTEDRADDLMTKIEHDLAGGH